MCGQVGMAGSLGHDKREFFKTLLHLSTLRGEDSTGVAYVTPENKYNMYKSTEPAICIMEHKRFLSVIENWNSWVWLGHNRKATFGKISTENTHPFFFRNCIGTHNGTLPHVDKNRLEGKGNNYETDSEALFHAINENKGEWPNEKIAGAWACAWYNFPEGSINLIRNDERPLFYAFTKDKKTLIWASESIFIQFASIRTSTEIGVIKLLPPYLQHKFLLPEKDKEITEMITKSVVGFVSEEEKQKIKEEKEKERKERWEHMYPAKKHDYTEYKLPVIIERKETNENIVDISKFLEKDYKNYDGTLINKNRFDQITSGMCGVCGNGITGPTQYMWISSADVICKDCAQDAATNPTKGLAELLKTTYPIAYKKLISKEA